MTRGPDIEERPLAERVALLGLADLTDRGRTPAHAFEVKEVCADPIEDVGGDALGRLSEKEVVRALNGLETTDLVVQTDAESRSTVGKGRPAYELGVDAGTVVTSLADDDRTSELVEAVRADRD